MSFEINFVFDVRLFFRTEDTPSVVALTLSHQRVSCSSKQRVVTGDMSRYRKCKLELVFQFLECFWQCVNVFIFGEGGICVADVASREDDLALLALFCVQLLLEQGAVPTPMKIIYRFLSHTAVGRWKSAVKRGVKVDTGENV